MESSQLDKLVLKTKKEDWTDDEKLVDQLTTEIAALTQEKANRRWAQLIPVVLQIASHFEHKLIGLHLLLHLIRHATPDLIKRNSVDQLLLFHLRKMFYQQEPNLYEHLFLILDLLCRKCPPPFAPGDRPYWSATHIPKQTTSLASSSASSVFNMSSVCTSVSTPSTASELDQITEIVLDAFQLSSDHNFRMCVVRRLPTLYLLLGVALFKHLQRLLDLHYDLLNVELTVSNDKLELVDLALISLRVLIERTREQGDRYLRQVLEALVKLAYGMQDEITGRAFARRLAGCLSSLRSVNSIRFDQLLQVASQIEELRIEKLNLDAGVDEMNFERI